MNRKEHALLAVRIASYHDDDRAAVAAYVENRVSRAAFDLELARGKAMRAAGVPCSCYQCKRAV